VEDRIIFHSWSKETYIFTRGLVSPLVKISISDDHLSIFHRNQLTSSI